MARVYAGRSAQERAATRRRRLLDAGLELLGTRGWSDTTVRGICEEAGLSTRFFYESFHSLEALALAVYDEIVEQTVAGVVTAVGEDGRTREERAHAGIEAMVSRVVDDPRRARVVLVESHNSEALAQRRMATMQDLASVVAMLGRTEYDVPQGAEPLLELTGEFVIGGVVEVLIAWLNRGLDIPRERLIEDCARLVIGVGDTVGAILRVERR